MDRNKKLVPIRTFSDDQGDPLEYLDQFFSFMAAVLGLGMLILIIEIIIWLIN